MKNSIFLKFTKNIVIKVAILFWIGVLLNQLPSMLGSDKAQKYLNYPIILARYRETGSGSQPYIDVNTRYRRIAIT